MACLTANCHQQLQRHTSNNQQLAPNIQNAP
jgi:hypothetical protein